VPSTTNCPPTRQHCPPACWYCLPVRSPVLPTGQAAQAAVRVARAQHHKLAAQLQGAVHGVLDEVDALLRQVKVESKGDPLR